jgi:hypothetical protein
MLTEGEVGLLKCIVMQLSEQRHVSTNADKHSKNPHKLISYSNCRVRIDEDIIKILDSTKYKLFGI